MEYRKFDNVIVARIEEKEVLNVIEAYSNALSLLDDYDHGCVSKPKGKNSMYQLTYEECSIPSFVKYIFWN